MHTLVRMLLWTTAGVCMFFILILAILYIPPCQDYIFSKVIKTLNGDESGIHIEYSHLRFKFPAQIEGKDIKATLHGDMQVSVGEINGVVSVPPLISGTVKSKKINLADIRFRMGTPDSAMYLNAIVENFNASDIEYGLKSGNTKVDNGVIYGTDVTLIFAPNDSVATDSAEISNTPIDIIAKHLELHRIKYFMQMPSLIDSLNASIDDIILESGHVNLGERNIEAKLLDVKNIDTKYIYTPITSTVAEKKETEVVPDSLMWSVGVNKVALTGNKVTYAVNGAIAVPGFDMNYIEATNIVLEVDSFYNCGANIKVPLKNFTATERCGLTVEANGVFEIANDVISADKFEINTNTSKISFDALMGLATPKQFSGNNAINANIKSKFGLSDISMAFPKTQDILSQLPPATELTANMSVSGNMSNIIVDNADINLSRLLHIDISGNASEIDKGIKSISGNLNLNGYLSNTHLIKPTIVEAKLGKGVALHPLNLKGHINMSHGILKSDVKILTDNGIIALNGNADIGPETYNVELNTNQFPIQAFMPTLGLSNMSMSLKAAGKKFNPLTTDAELKGEINLQHFIYNKIVYNGIIGNISVSGGNAILSLNSPVNGADLRLLASGSISGPQYNWEFNGSINDFNLQKLNMSATPLGGKFDFSGKANFNPDSMYADVRIDIPAIEVIMNETMFNTKNILLNFNTSGSQTTTKFINQDLNFKLTSPLGLDSIISRLSETAIIADSSVVRQRLELDSIAKKLPPFDADFSIGTKNIISAFLAKKGTSLESLRMTMTNDSAFALNGKLYRYVSPTTIVDTISIAMQQKADTISFIAKLNNAPESPGDLANVSLSGTIEPTSLSAYLSQNNFQGKTGLEVGANIEWKDSVVSVHFIPENPIIGYKSWSLNTSNFISLDFAKHSLNADLALSNNISSVRLYTKTANDSVGEKKTINLTAKDILLQDWIAINPYAPPIKGKVSGDVSVFHQGTTINGNANVGLSDFYYGKGHVGDFAFNANIETQPRGYIRARGEVDVNDIPVILINGHINDTTASEPFMLNMHVDSLPLNIANPFLSDAGLKMSGHLDGEMKVSGSPMTPTFDGFIAFDNTNVKVNMLGTEYAFGNDSIIVDNGLVIFDKYPIKGVNENPLVIDGTINMHNIANPVIDLSAKAKNIQLVGTDRARGGAEIFGKAFADFDATARGNMNLMRVNANVNVLRNTNVTYVLTDATQTLSSRSQSDIVKFVNFTDTLQVEQADSIRPIGMLLGVDANLQVQQGATIQVYISSDGKNRAYIQPQGSLDYKMDLMGAHNVTGRLSLNSGYARYTPPLMGEKLFNLQEGSYIAFNGNMMNPQLNIKAVDNVKANVTQSGQSPRLIYFDVSLAVTGTLEQMNVKFDLSTNDDITVENELSSMSPDQRASAAMNLLVTNMYTGPGTTATSNIGGNALYSFLESQLNSWAANNIKGVDLSFGVDQYDSMNNGAASQTTSYSYKVSKSLFDDRFKIMIGGNYTTDADTDENFSQNLINDIAFEYILNKSGSMTLKLFRHTGYESILEGEVTQTGIGLTYRKRLATLKQLFWFMRARYRKQMRLLEERRKANLSQEGL